MEFRGNQTTNNSGPQNQHVPATPAAPRFGAPGAGGSQAPGDKKNWLVMGVVAVVVVVLIVLGLWAWKSMGGSSDAAIKSDKYQAVFLTNGQVYFGKLSNANGDYVKLTDIYYLQVQQSVQPSTDAATQAQTQTSANQEDPKVSLAKLGSELHGPEDEMQISREQVLFWENLTDNSKTVKAIKEHQQSK